jgi:hypothetical protein
MACYSPALPQRFDIPRLVAFFIRFELAKSDLA